MPRQPAGVEVGRRVWPGAPLPSGPSPDEPDPGPVDLVGAVVVVVVVEDGEPWPRFEVVAVVVVVDVDGAGDGGAAGETETAGVTVVVGVAGVAGAETLGAGFFAATGAGSRRGGAASSPLPWPERTGSAPVSAAPIPGGGGLGAAGGAVASPMTGKPNVGRWSGPTRGSRVNPTATRPRYAVKPSTRIRPARRVSTRRRPLSSTNTGDALPTLGENVPSH